MSNPGKQQEKIVFSNKQTVSPHTSIWMCDAHRMSWSLHYANSRLNLLQCWSHLFDVYVLVVVEMGIGRRNERVAVVSEKFNVCQRFGQNYAMKLWFQWVQMPAMGLSALLLVIKRQLDFCVGRAVLINLNFYTLFLSQEVEFMWLLKSNDDNRMLN